MKMREFTVIVGESTYRMTEGGLKGVLELASKNVQAGVFAAKKGDVVILLNEPNLSREAFRRLTRDYNRRGFVLLHNRGASYG